MSVGEVLLGIRKDLTAVPQQFGNSGDISMRQAGL